MDVRGADPDKTLTRDVRFIYAKYPGGGEMEYRNEDTGWGIPWYFKFDSANLANRATDLKSTRAEPRWVVVRHYGWRVPMLDMFPNALSIREAAGPDEDLVPWFNIVFLSVLTLGLLMTVRAVMILRRRHVDPMVERIDAELDETAAWWRRLWRRLTGR